MGRQELGCKDMGQAGDSLLVTVIVQAGANPPKNPGLPKLPHDGGPGLVAPSHVTSVCPRHSLDSARVKSTVPISVPPPAPANGTGVTAWPCPGTCIWNLAGGSENGLGRDPLGGEALERGRGGTGTYPCSGLCPQPLLFTFATGPWSTAGCSLPCTGHGGWEQPPPCLSFPTAGQGWQQGAGCQEGELMELTHVGHTVYEIDGGGGTCTRWGACDIPETHGCSSALGPSLGPIQEPGWQWATNYPEAAPEGTTSRILTPLHTQPWEQETLRKGDVGGARIPSVVLHSLSRSRAVSEPSVEDGLRIWPQQQGSTNRQVTTRIWHMGPCREGLRGRGRQASSSRCQRLIYPLSCLSFPYV